MHSLWLVFSIQLVNCGPHGRRNYTCVLLPLYLHSDLPLPFRKVNARGGERGVLSCVVDHILQDFNTLFLTRFRTYKVVRSPQTKMDSKNDIQGLVSLKFLRPCVVQTITYLDNYSLLPVNIQFFAHFSEPILHF